MQVQREFTKLQKLCLNMCSMRWLGSCLRLVRRFRPYGSLMLWTRSGFGQLNFNSEHLNIKYDLTLPIPESSLFPCIKDVCSAIECFNLNKTVSTVAMMLWSNQLTKIFGEWVLILRKFNLKKVRNGVDHALNLRNSSSRSLFVQG